MGIQRVARGVRVATQAGYLVGRLRGNGQAKTVSMQEIGQAIAATGTVAVVGSAPPATIVAAGTGISVSLGGVTYTVTNTGVLSNIAGSGISVSGATGNVTIGNTGVLSVTAPAAGFTVNAATGAVTFTLANDLAALEALGSTGLAARTAANTWAQRTITGPAAGITVSDGDGVAGNPTLALANDLSGLEGLSTTGVAVRTASDTWTTRTITGTANRVTITNGDGVAGAPTLDISSSYVGQNTITTLGTVGTGTWQAGVIAGTYGGTGVNNGASTITIGGNVVFSGAFAATITSTATTNSTLPAGTHTLAGLDVAQTWTAEQTYTFSGATNSIKVSTGTTLTTYNIVTFNGVKTTSGMLGLLGGGGTDNYLYAFTPTGGGYRVAVNGATIFDFDASGIGMRGSTSGTLTVKPPAIAGTNTITLPAGTTDFSATGGTSQFVKQASAGAALTVVQPAAADLSDFTTWTTDTPTVTAASGTFTTVSGTQKWLKIGKLLHVIGSVTITTNGTAGGSVLVTFPTNGGAFSVTGTIVCSGRGTSISGKMLQGNAADATHLSISNYDNTYPGATGEVLVFSYFAQLS